MKKATKAAVTAAGIGLAGVGVGAAACYGAARHLMKITLDRDGVKGPSARRSKLFSGSDILTRYGRYIDEASGKLEARSLEPVEIVGGDGVRLMGHLYRREGAERFIIAMHGWRSSWSRDFGFIADFWFDHRCDVLFAEQRGQNNSGGRYMGFGMLERYDCLDWVRWAERETDLPIYLDGLSMGATTVLMAAGLDLPKSVHGIMADCGFTSPHAIWKHVSEKNLHLPYGLNGYFADKICKKRLRMGSRECSAADALRNSTVPVLFIHGTDDRFVPVEMTFENYKACASPKRLFIVPGADHGMAYHIDRPGYQQAVLDFWKAYD